MKRGPEDEDRRLYFGHTVTVTADGGLEGQTRRQDMGTQVPQ